MPIQPVPDRLAMRNRSGFTLLEMMVVMCILSIVLGIVSDCLVRGSQASQTIDVAGDLQERADAVVNQIALHVRGVSSAGNNTVQVSIPATTSVGVASPVLQFIPSTGFSYSGVSSTAVDTPGSSVRLSVTYPTSGTGTLNSTDLGWGRTASSLSGILCNDVATTWVGPDITALGYPSGGVVTGTAGLGFFCFRTNDSSGLPTLLIVGLCLQVSLPDGRTIWRSSVREIHLSP